MQICTVRIRDLNQSPPTWSTRLNPWYNYRYRCLRLCVSNDSKCWLVELTYGSRVACTEVRPQNWQALPYHLTTWLHLCALSFPLWLLPNLFKEAHYFNPELTLDHQTSLSSPTNPSPRFVSSAHVDPWVLHTNIWDHQIPRAEYLDSLHADGTAI